MSEENNPFMVAPKPVKKEPEREITFGTDEVVSFMVAPGEAKDTTKSLVDNAPKPHWEKSGTPMWDRKDLNVDNPDYEVVDHEEE